MQPDFVQQALKALCPDTPNWYGWNILADGHSWENAKVIQDGVSKPTKAEFDAKLIEVQAQYQEQQIDGNRKAAYTTESDPLFFKAQRGEATMEEWQAKVAKIKTRYPKD